MILFAESNEWVGLLSALIGATSTVILGYLAYLQMKLKAAVDHAAQAAQKDASKAAVEVEKVSETSAINDRKMDDQTRKLDAVHTLVNSNMGVQLRVGAVALRRVAELTKHPDDRAAAELAEKLLAEHETKQAKVDSREAASSPGQAHGG